MTMTKIHLVKTLKKGRIIWHQMMMMVVLVERNWSQPWMGTSSIELIANSSSTTVERIVDESNDVAYAYFRKTGLERSQGLAKDLAWIRQQGFVIPEPSNPGVSYAKYLNELAEKSAPLFLFHFYNIYSSHIAGGQVIAKQVSKKLLEGREMDFY